MNVQNRDQAFRRGIVIFVVILGIAGYLLYRYRQHRIDLLFLQSAGYPAFFQSTEQSQSAIKKLATYRGKAVTQRLVAIATGNVWLPMPQTQTEAINALARRDDPSTSTAIAGLLQPSESYPVREAAATALQKLPCDAECVSEILHYLERVWQGELNFEERTIFSGKMGESIRADAGKDEASLYRQLIAILQRERGTTIEILERVYGLGSVAPSKFAFMVVSRAEFREACPLLMKDEKDVEGTEKWLLAPREELMAAIQTLHCQ